MKEGALPAHAVGGVLNFDMVPKRSLGEKWCVPKLSLEQERALPGRVL